MTTVKKTAIQDYFQALQTVQGNYLRCDEETKFKYPNSQVSKKIQPRQRHFLLIFQLDFRVTEVTRGARQLINIGDTRATHSSFTRL
jgi:hypothetical protein